MKPVIIIAIALVLLLPTVAHADFIDLKILIPNEFHYNEQSFAEVENQKNIEAVITKNDETYAVSISQIFDEELMDGLWNYFKYTRNTIKFPEDVTNFSATCFQGWTDEQMRQSWCIKDEFVVIIASNRDTLPVMKQIIDKIDGTTSLSKITEIEIPNGGGCLIATATYGSELIPQVQQLRELRDNQLLQTESGTNFMNSFNDFYYSFSPYIADYERENPVFREAVKIAITPMISSLLILNYVDMDSEKSVLGYGISLILLNVGMYFVAPAIVIVKLKQKY